MKKQKKKTCKQMIVDVFKKKKKVTFDWEKGNPDGFTSIHWLIAESILSGWARLPVGYKKLLRGWAEAVKENLGPAIAELRDEYQIPVYTGTRNSIRIMFITTDPEYRNAKQEDAIRMSWIRDFLNDAINRRMKFNHPELPGETPRPALPGAPPHVDHNPEAPEGK